MNIADLLASDVRSSFGEYMKAIRTTGRASGLMKIQTADGESRYLEYNNTLRTEGVIAPLVRGMGQDVTAARLAKAALRRSETQLRSFIEHAPAEMAMFDHQMICLAASQRWIENVQPRAPDAGRAQSLRGQSRATRTVEGASSASPGGRVAEPHRGRMGSERRNPAVAALVDGSLARLDRAPSAAS